MKTPIGYTLVREPDEEGCATLYTFSVGGIKHDTWYTWKLGCIDAMWADVRARATREATLSAGDREAKSTLTYAIGYHDSRVASDAAVRLCMARAGYAFDDSVGAVEIVQKLLIMLNGER
jgi:hypothetical protein